MLKKSEDSSEAQNLRIRLTAYQNEKNLSQKTMATKLGMQRSTYANIVSGKRKPSITFLRKVAKLIGKSMEELCDG